MFSEDRAWVCQDCGCDPVSKRFRVACTYRELDREEDEDGKILFVNTESEETQREPPIVEDVRSVYEISNDDDTKVLNSGSADPERRCRLTALTVRDVEYDNIRLCPAKLASKSVLDLSRLRRERMM